MSADLKQKYSELVALFTPGMLLHNQVISSDPPENIDAEVSKFTDQLFVAIAAVWDAQMAERPPVSRLTTL